MKIRGAILATLVMVVFFASYAKAIEQEPEQPSSAAPVMVPYMNKTINEVTKNAGHYGTDTDDTDGYFTQADEARRETGQDPDDPDEAAGNNDTDAEDGGRLGEPEGSAEWAAGVDIPGGGSGSFTDHTASGDSAESMPELVGAEVWCSSDEGGIEDAYDAGTGIIDAASDSDTEGISGTEGIFAEGQEDYQEDYPVPGERIIYLGEWTVTAYCSCPECCGVWATGCTASGVLATAGHTVACGILPFGSRVMIDDVIYTVEDTGVDGEWIDIYFDSHEEALAYGMQVKSVYLIEE